jgi:AraC family transcriptional regulator of adaptative response / DNA-3-methyladenine glycosylase II
MTEVALAAGFGGIRRFNEMFRELFHRPPSTLRRGTSSNSSSPEAGVKLRLRYRPPYDWDSIAQLSASARDTRRGSSRQRKLFYLRTIGPDRFTGSVQVLHLPEHQCLCVTIRFPRVQSLPAIISRVRRRSIWARTSKRLTLTCLSGSVHGAVSGSTSRVTRSWRTGWF